MYKLQFPIRITSTHNRERFAMWSRRRSYIYSSRSKAKLKTPGSSAERSISLLLMRLRDASTFSADQRPPSRASLFTTRRYSNAAGLSFINGNPEVLIGKGSTASHCAYLACQGCSPLGPCDHQHLHFHIAIGPSETQLISSHLERMKRYSHYP
jgi:hypothetical protein